MPVALITGAASGIGRATVELLRQRGWWVAAADVSEQLPPCELPLCLDVRDPAAWAEAVKQVEVQGGGELQLLVNSAGLGGGGPVEELEPERARLLVEVNLLGTLYGVQAALPLLRATPGARVVNLGSMLGFHGVPQAALYSSTKAAVHALSQALELELEGVTVQALAPGIVATPLAGSLTEHEGEVLTPQQVALAIVEGRGGGVRAVGREAGWVGRLARWWPGLLRRGMRR